MTPHPVQTPHAVRRLVLGWGAVALMFVVLTLLDHHLWAILRFDPEKALEGKDWWQVLRQFGSLLVWAIIGVCIGLVDANSPAGTPHAPPPPRRGLMVFLGAASGGALAELLKLISRRSRPLGDGRYHFGWVEHVDGYGLASSHAGVAFGGAIMLSWLFPALRVPVLLLASGTAMTRLAVGAHYATDVFAAIILSYAGCTLVWRLLGASHPASDSQLRSSA